MFDKTRESDIIYSRAKIMIFKEIKRIFILVILSILLNISTFSYAKEIPFTQDDRDRLIRLETKVDEGLKAVNQRIDDTNRRIDDTNRRIDELRALILWGFGILFGGMGILIGFVIWDRRTALAPAIKKNKELEEREERIERALKELAEKDPRVAEALKHVGLL